MELRRSALRLRPMNTVSSPRRQIGPDGLIVLVVFLVIAVAACTGSGASPASPVPTVAIGPAGTPVGSFVVAPTGSPSASSNALAGPITSAEAAFAAVRARSPWFDAVAVKDPNMVGQAAWWQATPSRDGAWTVTVDMGWGDCEAGCIEHHVWIWQVASDGSVTLQSQTGSAVSADQRLALTSKATTGGIGGEVTAGPTCPVERPGDAACAERPVKGAVLVVQDGSGKEVARFTTDASGLFRIALAPATYTLAPQSVTGLMGTAEPQQVTVAAGKLTAVSLSYDTGIR